MTVADIDMSNGSTFQNMPEQCIESCKHGLSTTRCTEKAVYGYYCEIHGTAPQGSEQQAEAARLDAAIEENLARLGFGAGSKE